MTFQKGQSGNPAGRVPRRLPDGRSLAEVAREYTPQAIEALVKILTKGTSETAIIAAANAIIDRGWGKAKQPITGGDDDDAPIRTEVDLKGLSTEALRELARVCA
jgi:hypothetical protein